MKKVVVRGPVLTQSGYGVHCRQVASWITSKSDVDVKFQALPWGDTPWILNKNAHEGLIDKIVKNTVDISVPFDKKFDLSLQLQLPNEWDPSIAKYNVGLTAGVETDFCNPDWVKACNKMDMIIVPSKHAESSLRRSGDITTAIKIVPESFCNEILEDLSNEVDKLPKFSTNFNFLIFGQITGDNPLNDRKNIFFTIKWLCESFKDDKDVGIVIKTNVGRNTQIDRRRTKQMMEALIKECRKGEFPRIHLLHGDIPDKQVAALYKHEQIKALVSLTRGEGYGLPILEAAASGLPVIVTGWSGHTDFLNHGKYINISYNLKPVHNSRIDNKIFMPGAKWAEAIEEDFKKKIIKFKNNHSMPKKWADDLSKIIKNEYSLNSVFSKYDEALKYTL
jgi:glycosyltransferase involved in cell wall biosynthesis